MMLGKMQLILFLKLLHSQTHYRFSKAKVEHKSCAAYKDVAALEGHPDIQPTGAMSIWDIEDLVQLGTDLHGTKQRSFCSVCIVTKIN